MSFLLYFASIRKAPLTSQRCVHVFMVGLYGSRVSLSGSMVSQHGPRVNLHGPRGESTHLQGWPPLSTALGWSSKASGRQSTATVWAFGPRPEVSSDWGPRINLHVHDSRVSLYASPVKPCGSQMYIPSTISCCLQGLEKRKSFRFFIIMPSTGSIGKMATNLILYVQCPHLKIYRGFLFRALLPFLLHSYAFPWTNKSYFLS